MTTTRSPARRWMTALLVGGTLLATGCSTSVDEAASDYCASLSSLEDLVTELQSLVETDAPLDTIQSQVGEISDAYDAAVENAGEVDQAVADEAQQAYQDFQDAVAQIPDDVALGEGATQFGEAARGFQQDLTAVSEDASCG